MLKQRRPDDFVVALDGLERARRGQLTRAIARAMMIAVWVTMGLTFLDRRNDILLAAYTYAPIVVVILVTQRLAKNGYDELAAWILAGSFWLLVFLSTWFFGGLQNEMATAYVLSVLIAAGCLGGRAALIFGGLCIAGATLVLWAHLTGNLPKSLVPPMVVNAWISVVISVAIASVLVVSIMRSLRRALGEALEAANERDRARERALAAQRLEPVGRLASGVAHDFNNLITVMNSSIDQLRFSPALDQGAREALEDMERATAQAAEMTRQLLALTRGGRLDAPVQVDPISTVRRIAPLVRRLLGADVRLEVELQAPGATVLADQTQLEQAIMNLAINARDAMPQGGEIHILCSKDQSSCRIVVQDDGVGMSKETLQAAFAPFFTTKERGTGIGLATVREFAERFGGRAELESEVGRGTKVAIVLPLAAENGGTTLRTAGFPDGEKKAS